MIPHNATESRPPVEPLDEQFLDELFDQLVGLLGDGRSPDVTELISGREHLRVRVLELLTLAREVTGAPDPATPQLAGFPIVRKLGEGGMGAVFLARQERLGGRLVALKVLPPHAVSPRALERFEREAAALAGLRDPHIVTVHDVVRTPASNAYAMEWIDGGSLADLVRYLADEYGTSAAIARKSGAGSWARGSMAGSAMMEAVRVRLQPPPGALGERSYVAFIANIGLAIARALATVHAAGLLHRDVKPSNILLRRDGTPLLSDFGLVRDTDATITQPGSFAGTPAYAPPEQLRGDSDELDARSDVYALGATLYHALSLQLPLKGRNPAELLRQIERAGPPPLRKLNPRIPIDLQTIVSKAMEPDPARRYQTAAEMADDLERLLTLQPIRAKPAGLVTRSIKLVRRNRGAFAGVVAGGLSALTIAALLLVYFVLMPRWVAQHTREARLALLDPAQANNIVSVLYWGRFNQANRDVRARRAALLDTAIESYDAALRFAPLDAALREERDMVAAARDALAARAQPSDANPPPVRDAYLALRTSGLHAFLTDDFEVAIRDWTAYESSRDPLAEPDALVSAALGVLYLFDDQPARAYPRLRDAVRAFPDVGFLTLYLADAALKSGDPADAEILLSRSRSQHRRDEHGGEQRVAAGLLAAAGDLAGAEAALGASGGLPGPAWLDHARLLERAGRTEESIDRLLTLASLGGDLPRRIYRDALERWWRSLPPAERLRNIRASLDLPPFDPRSLATRLREYQQPEPARPPSPRSSFVAPSLFLEFSLALFDALSSPSLQSLSLSELAQRMEVHDMNCWNRLSTSTTWTTGAHLAAWRWNCLRGLVRLVCGCQTPAQRTKRAAVSRAVQVAAVFSAPSIGLAQNLLQNGSFETGDLSAWTVSGEATVRDVAPAPEGTHFAQFSYLDTPNFGVLSQTVETIPGVHYRLDFWYGAIDYVGHPQSLRVSALSGPQVVAQVDVGPVSYGPVYEFEPYVLEFVADGVSTTIEFRDISTQTVSADGLLDAVSLTAPCTAPPCFHGLGDLPGGDISSGALAVSADGSTVVGYSSVAGGYEAVRWRRESGLVSLGEFSGGLHRGRGFDVSADGSVVVGLSSSANGTIPEFDEAFRWTAATGMVSAGELPGSQFYGRAFTVTHDGGTAFGASWGDQGYVPTSFSGGIAANLWSNPVWSPAGARGTSADGSVVVGEYWNGSYHTPLRNGQTLPDVPGGALDSIPFNVSPDGSLIVGEGQSDVGRQAAVWIGDTVTALPDLDGGTVSGSAKAATDTGLIVGWGTTELGTEAAIWDATYAVHRLADVLTSNGVVIPSGWVLTEAADITVNGDIVTLCGTGTNPAGETEAWIARYTLPAEPCPGDVDGDLDVDLSDLGAMLAAYGACDGDPGYDAGADFDDNGCIDLSDLGSLLTAYGQPCN